VILAAHTSPPPLAALLHDLGQVLRSHLPRRARRVRDAVPTVEETLVRALCHDMRGSVACLESTLGHLTRRPDDELLEIAQAQAAHLASMLRTAEATGGAPRRAPRGTPLRDVVSASLAASGLPRGQLTLDLGGCAGEVAVGDARLQRILVNLLENAHRHGDGAPVRLTAHCRPGWLRLELRQDGVPARRVVGHLCTEQPPADLTGLGLWSVQRQARELGGEVTWDDDGAALTLVVDLPDR
jgi:signal transduction histidine kinase